VGGIFTEKAGNGCPLLKDGDPSQKKRISIEI